MGLLDKAIIKNLSLGKHLIKVTDVKEDLDRNSKEYLSLGYQADGKPEVRRKLVYETELQIMADGIGQQHAVEFDTAADLIQFISEHTFQVDVTEVYIPEKDKTYTNWKYNV